MCGFVWIKHVVCQIKSIARFVNVYKLRAMEPSRLVDTQKAAGQNNPQHTKDNWEFSFADQHAIYAV